MRLISPAGIHTRHPRRRFYLIISIHISSNRPPLSLSPWPLRRTVMGMDTHPVTSKMSITYNLAGFLRISLRSAWAISASLYERGMTSLCRTGATLMHILLARVLKYGGRRTVKWQLLSPVQVGPLLCSSLVLSDTDLWIRNRRHNSRYWAFSEINGRRRCCSACGS